MLWLRRPEISVVVVVHKMQREAPRTLFSLSAGYQRGVTGSEYEVVVVENRSDQMLSTKQVRSFGRQFRYFVNPRPSRSPAGAMNLGVRKARGRNVLLLIDGARILSPGILRHTLTSLRLYRDPVVATLAWHLGPDNQARSIHQGYCQQVEDQLLAGSHWETNGYDLFPISSLAGSCSQGWFFPLLESNCLAMSREHFKTLGGISEEFQTLGGGFVNLDFYARAVAAPNRPLVILLGEGTFHQVHGGAATNRQDDEPIRQFQAEYQRIRGREFVAPATNPIYFGSMPEEAKPFLRASILQAEQLHRQHHPSLAATSVATKSELHPIAAQPSSQVLTVLGMHRSGTSCLAGTLMECGVDFGEVSRKNNFNLKGNNENQQIMDLHDRILADNDGSWKEPPATVHWSQHHREIRDEIIVQFRQKESARWGFKDPRTLVTLDGWLDALPEMQLVGIFRHPDAVAQSLTQRNLFSRQTGHELWCHYNRRLLAQHQRRPFPILYFSEQPDEFFQQRDRLIALLNLDPPVNGFQFFEPSLQHFEPPREERLPSAVADLYRQLHSVAFYHPEIQRTFTPVRQAA